MKPEVTSSETSIQNGEALTPKRGAHVVDAAEQLWPRSRHEVTSGEWCPRRAVAAQARCAPSRQPAVKDGHAVMAHCLEHPPSPRARVDTHAVVHDDLARLADTERTHFFLEEVRVRHHVRQARLLVADARVKIEYAGAR